GNEKNLAIGSVIYLKDTLKKVMIISKKMVREFDGEPVYIDYTGCLYPEGLITNDILVFNQEDISSIIFRGYEDEDEIELAKRMAKWENKASVKKLSKEEFRLKITEESQKKVGKKYEL
ncbi:DUF4176 domain-containing protein, partial [Listeria monocytogenes]|nr:DUF4176 domain-containing protein [Listeria monocytogenes]